MLLNVIILTLITSFAAMILMNGAIRIRNSEASLNLVALHLVNEQIAFLESRAENEQLSGNYPFLGDNDDLTVNFGEDNPVEFKVDTRVSGTGKLRTAKVIVTWQVGGKDFKLEAERTIYIAK